MEYFRSIHQPLLDQETKARLPALYSGEDKGMDAVAVVKFFTPTSNWTWFASEGSPVDADGHFDNNNEKVDFLCFGLVVGQEIEFGYFSIKELERAIGSFGEPFVERDLYYKPKTLGELLDEYRARRSGE